MRSRAKGNCHSRGWFRSIDLWVMGPARFRCATLLPVGPSLAPATALRMLPDSTSAPASFPASSPCPRPRGKLSPSKVHLFRAWHAYLKGLALPFSPRLLPLALQGHLLFHRPTLGLCRTHSKPRDCMTDTLQCSKTSPEGSGQPELGDPLWEGEGRGTRDKGAVLKPPFWGLCFLLPRPILKKQQQDGEGWDVGADGSVAPAALPQGPLAQGKVFPCRSRGPWLSSRCPLHCPFPSSFLLRISGERS